MMFGWSSRLCAGDEGILRGRRKEELGLGEGVNKLGFGEGMLRGRRKEELGFCSGKGGISVRNKMC